MSASQKEESQANFDSLCKKYEHLQWSLYPYSDKKNSSGRYVRYDREKQDNDQSSIQQAMAAQMTSGSKKSRIKTLKRKIKRNTRKGRTAKVAALTAELRALEASQSASGGEKDTASTISNAQWEDIVRTIKRLDKNAYRTVIYIDHHPRTWKSTNN